MSQYSGIILGDIPETCHKDSNYFYERFCFIDCRGPLEVHEKPYFGFGVKIITLSHNTESWPLFGELENKGVRILDGAWIGYDGDIPVMESEIIQVVQGKLDAKKSKKY